MNTDRETDSKKMERDRQDACLTVFVRALQYPFIWRCFSTIAVCGKTYGNVFGESGKRVFLRRNLLVTNDLEKCETVSYFLGDVKSGTMRFPHSGKLPEKDAGR